MGGKYVCFTYHSPDPKPVVPPPMPCGGTTSPAEGFYCGRGGQPCADGFYCDIHPSDMWAVCCRSPPKYDPTYDPTYDPWYAYDPSYDPRDPTYEHNPGHRG